MTCASCGHQSLISDGVLQCFTDEQASDYKDFLHTYTEVRLKEGRASYDADALRGLPACPPSLPMADQWRIRARSYQYLMRTLCHCLAPAAKILDLGAGNGWLSNRLAEAGFSPCAVDLSINNDDGLGAAQLYDTRWPRLQAAFDNMPLEDSQADAIVFNASFHYCANQQATVAESLRVLRPGGLLVILDSPVYNDASSGVQMLVEQQQYFERLIGRRSDSVDVTGYLTWRQLENLGNEFDLNWTIRKPWYGLRWWLRPWRAKLRKEREPASFAVISTIAK